MDYGILPPEINSARIYTGPGSGPILAAASAWGGLAARAEFRGIVLHCGDLRVDRRLLGRSGCRSRWRPRPRPTSTWMSTAAAQAEETAGQAKAAAAALRSGIRDDGSARGRRGKPGAAGGAGRDKCAWAKTPPAIAATEALYAEMWAQDAAAMYGYAGSSAAAAAVTPFSSPPQTTNSAGRLARPARLSQATGTSTGTGVQSTLSQVVSTVPNALQGLASPVVGCLGRVNPFAPGSNTATTGIAGLLNLLDGTNWVGDGDLLEFHWF